MVDFDTEDALRKALMAVRLLPNDSGDASLEEDNNDDDDNNTNNDNNSSTPGGAPIAQPKEDNDDDMPSASDNLDWVLPSFDPETTEAQSMREELHRLTVLKNYLILDADREEVFDRLTGLASRFYNVPISLISLVDLGRQWFLSNRGLGEVRETPRRHAFCAHAILNKHNILIVPDATKDFRFKDNPLVTGPPNIRFYAGAVSGFKMIDFHKSCSFLTLVSFVDIWYSRFYRRKATNWGHFVLLTIKHVRQVFHRMSKRPCETWPIWPCEKWLIGESK